MHPRLCYTSVAGRTRDPFDFLSEMVSYPPLPSEEEIQLILSKTPPEDIIIGLDKQLNGEFSPTHYIITHPR